MGNESRSQAVREAEESPSAWLCALEIARKRGDSEGEEQALARLRELGVRVEFGVPRTTTKPGEMTNAAETTRGLIMPDELLKRIGEMVFIALRPWLLSVVNEKCAKTKAELDAARLRMEPTLRTIQKSRDDAFKALTELKAEIKRLKAALEVRDARIAALAKDLAAAREAGEKVKIGEAAKA